MSTQMIFNTIVLPMVRHGLQAVAGYLMAQGQLDPTNAETLTGGVIAIVTVGWWYFTRSKPVAK